MGPVETAIRTTFTTLPVTLLTIGQRRPFVLSAIDHAGIVLLLGQQRAHTRLSWACLEAIVPFLRSRTDWVTAGGVHSVVGEPGTLDEHLKQCIKRDVSRWLVVVLRDAGVVEVHEGPPLSLRLPRAAPARVVPLAPPVAVGVGRQFSVATWNLHHGVDHRSASMEATWGYLRDVIRPTVALIQESDGVPPTPGGHVLTRPEDEPWIRFDTAVVGYEGRVEPLTEVVSRYARRGRPSSIRPTYPLTQIAARVEIPGTAPIVAVSLYGRIDTYAQNSILHALADLIPLFDDPRYPRVIIGGDLNAFDNGPRVDRVSRERWGAIFEVLHSLGLVNLLDKRREEERRAGMPPLAGCTCRMGDACYHVETWRWQRRPGVWCLDYLFVTKELESRLVGQVEVWGETHPEVWGISDHCPLVARFEL